MFTIFSIRRFLLFNLLSTVIATIIITAFANYYIDCQAINEGLDNLLVETGLLLKTITDNPHSLRPATLKVIQSQLNTNSLARKNLTPFSNLKAANNPAKELRYKLQL